jgi:hypothetical protein
MKICLHFLCIKYFLYVKCLSYNFRTAKKNQSKKTKAERKPQAKTKSSKSQTKVTNRFAVLEDAGSSAEKEIIVETAAVAMQSQMPMEADGRVNLSADDVEDESSESPNQSREISPDVVVESDSADNEEIMDEEQSTDNQCAEIVTTDLEKMEQDVAEAVEMLDVSRDLGVKDVSVESNDEFKSAESGIDIDSVSMKEGSQSSKSKGKQWMMPKAEVATSREVVRAEKIANTGSHTPSSGRNDGLIADEKEATPPGCSNAVKVENSSSEPGQDDSAGKYRYSAGCPARRSWGAQQQDNRNELENGKTKNHVAVSGVVLPPPGKRSPQTSWAGWGATSSKGSSDLSKHAKSSTAEWTFAGENQPYFWSDAPGLPQDKRLKNLKGKSENDDLTCEEKCVEVVTSAGDNVWEEPKARRQRRQRNRDHDTPTPPSKLGEVLPEEPCVPPNKLGEEFPEPSVQVTDSRTEIEMLNVEEENKDVDTPSAADVTEDARSKSGAAEFMDGEQLSDQNHDIVSDVKDSVEESLPVVTRSQASESETEVPPKTPQISPEPSLVISKENTPEESDGKVSLEEGNNFDTKSGVSEVSNANSATDASISEDVLNAEPNHLSECETSDEVNVMFSIENSIEETVATDAEVIIDVQSEVTKSNETATSTMTRMERSMKLQTTMESQDVGNSLKADGKSETVLDVDTHFDEDLVKGVEKPPESDPDIESDSSIKADFETKIVGNVDSSIEVDTFKGTEGDVAETVLVKSPIDFDIEAKVSVLDDSNAMCSPENYPKEEPTDNGDFGSGSPVVVPPDHDLGACAGCSSVFSLQDLCKTAINVEKKAPEEHRSDEEPSTTQEGPIANTPPRKTKSIKSKLSPRQKFVQGIREDIVAIRNTLPRDWSLPAFPVTPTSASLELNLSLPNSEQEIKEFTESGTYTSSYDFVLLYKVQKNLPCNLSDIKIIAYGTDVAVGGITAGSQSNSAPGSPRKRTPFLLDKSCSTNEVLIPSSMEEDLVFLQSCFPTVSRNDLKEILDVCSKDVEWAVNLLLDSGYEYNTPKTPKERSKSQGRDDDKDIDTAQDSIAEVQTTKDKDLKQDHTLEANVLESQVCFQPGGLATLSQNVLSDSSWLNSWGSLGGYDLQMPGDYHFDVSDLAFEQTTLTAEQTTLPSEQTTQSLGEQEKGRDKDSITTSDRHSPMVISDLDEIDNVEIKTRNAADVGSDFFGLIPTSESADVPDVEIDITTAHEKANLQPPLQSSTPKVEENKYQTIIDTVTGVSSAPNIEPIVYMPIPGIQRLKGSYDYPDQSKGDETTDSFMTCDTSLSPDDTREEEEKELSDEDCGLSMQLSPEMALGLQEMFGPVGFHVNAGKINTVS